jgi:L-ribulose-5-phosphate 3-epimerase
MQKGINYWAFPASQNTTAREPEAVMAYAKELGYDAFEWTVEETGTVSLETNTAVLREIRSAAERIGIGLPTVACGLAWSYSPSSPDTAVRDQAVANTTRTLEIAAELGAETVLYIPGAVSAVFVPGLGPVAYSTVMDHAVDSVERVLPTAERLGVKLGVENVWNRFLLDPLSMGEFIDRFDSPWLGSYFDTGNVMLYGHPEDWIRTLGSRIFAVHVKDFRVSVGSLDGFVDVLAGDVDFRAVMAAFREVCYAGPYTIEYVPPTLGAAEKGIAALKLIEGEE